MYVYMYVCMHVCMYLCMYVCMYVCQVRSGTTHAPALGWYDGCHCISTPKDDIAAQIVANYNTPNRNKSLKSPNGCMSVCRYPQKPAPPTAGPPRHGHPVAMAHPTEQAPRRTLNTETATTQSMMTYNACLTTPGMGAQNSLGHPELGSI